MKKQNEKAKKSKFALFINKLKNALNLIVFLSMSVFYIFQIISSTNEGYLVCYAVLYFIAILSFIFNAFKINSEKKEKSIRKFIKLSKIPVDFIMLAISIVEAITIKAFNKIPFALVNMGLVIFNAVIIIISIGINQKIAGVKDKFKRKLNKDKT